MSVVSVRDEILIFQHEIVHLLPSKCWMQTKKKKNDDKFQFCRHCSGGIESN